MSEDSRDKSMSDSELKRLQVDIARRQATFWRFVSVTGSVFSKALIWGVFFGILWILRDFFALVFMTFVFSFVSTSIVRSLMHHFPKLKWRMGVICVFSGFLVLTAAVVWLAIPQVKQGVWQLKETIQELPAKWDKEIDPWLYDHVGVYRRLVSEEVEIPIEEGDDGQPKPIDDQDESPPPPADDSGDKATASVDQADKPATRTILQRKTFWEVDKVREFLNDTQNEWLQNVPNVLRDVVTAIAAVFSLLFLSLLFSFLILFDLQSLRLEVAKLEETKLARFYKETVQNIVQFGAVLGKVLEAQAVIALVNTALTAIALSILGVPNVGFLSLLVFVCGFIPVAGVFISSVPVCLIGLFSGGITTMLILIGVITAIHFLEAYVLNPRIMGAALHVNPVLVLIILVIGHHVMGIWGLLLGVPICYYFFTHVIKREDKEIGLRVRLKPRRIKPDKAK
ncbi:MAG TPA: AI-2E family transporter [Planctomycetes bacterium]|nr:AI-2E family transporter [Planctomycetota bacterium]